MPENNATLDRPVRLKRLRMRAWRRGMKEMDIILGTFVDTQGPSLSDARLDALETLMDRQDQQLFRWVSGTADAAPDDASESERAIMAEIKDAFSLTNPHGPPGSAALPLGFGHRRRRAGRRERERKGDHGGD